LATKDVRVGDHCRQFYRELEHRKGAIHCPWDIRLEYSVVESPVSDFGVFVQTGVDGARAHQKAASLRRQSKKSLQRAVASDQDAAFPLPADDQLLERFPRQVETVLAGVAAGAIRAIAHEMQTPIQGAFIDAVELRDSPDTLPLPADVRERIGRLVGNLQSVKDLAKRIPFLTTGDLEYSSAQLRHVTVHHELDRIIDQLRPQADTRHIRFDRGFNAGPEVLRAVPDQFQMVFLALLQNAVKYSFDGRPERLQYVKITFEAFPDEGLSIRVQNVGPAIGVDEIRDDKLFDLNYRGRFSGARRSGTGSGLYLANRLVRAHGGRIMVRSNPVGTFNGEPATLNDFEVVWPVEPRKTSGSAL
jgi:signal transduction histidine kinase